MLHYDTIDPGTLRLLKKCIRLDCLSDFHLVDGTALGLELGNRRSIDLDMFSADEFDTADLLSRLAEIGKIKYWGKNRIPQT